MPQSRLIVVADATRARFFSVEMPELGAETRGARLVERSDLVNPEARSRGMQQSSGASARNRQATQSSAHGYPDHRPGHEQEVQHQFAQRIIAVAAEFIKLNATTSLVLFAPAHLLGELRISADESLPPAVKRHEFAEELSWHSVPRIEAAVARLGLLPATTAQV